MSDNARFVISMVLLIASLYALRNPTAAGEGIIAWALAVMAGAFAARRVEVER